MNKTFIKELFDNDTIREFLRYYFLCKMENLKNYILECHKLNHIKSKLEKLSSRYNTLTFTFTSPFEKYTSANYFDNIQNIKINDIRTKYGWNMSIDIDRYISNHKLFEYFCNYLINEIKQKHILEWHNIEIHFYPVFWDEETITMRITGYVWDKEKIEKEADYLLSLL